MRIKGSKFITLHMHPEIEAALTVSKKVYREIAPLDALTLETANRLLAYIADINLERKGKFVPTFAESLYMLWSVDDWEFHIECIKNGHVLYTFCKGGHEEESGNNEVEEFIPKLEKYLLMGVA